MPASTKSFHFPDIHVWIALTWDGHVHHRRAADWFAELDDDSRLFFCRFTQLGVLRLLTSEAVMGQDVLTQRSAWQAYDRWHDDERVGSSTSPSISKLGFDRSHASDNRLRRTGRTRIWLRLPKSRISRWSPSMPR